MNAPLIPQANPGAAFRSQRDALLKAAADVLEVRSLFLKNPDRAEEQAPKPAPPKPQPAPEETWIQQNENWF